ncbi:MAG: hypothetical protein AcusKO_20100 [Acuticoccus sp.]
MNGRGGQSALSRRHCLPNVRGRSFLALLPPRGGQGSSPSLPFGRDGIPAFDAGSDGGAVKGIAALRPRCARQMPARSSGRPLDDAAVLGLLVLFGQRGDDGETVAQLDEAGEVAAG